jgi:murein DD-endopeptidase MepM/ murein hydrolase activator NlpD
MNTNSSRHPASVRLLPFILGIILALNLVLSPALLGSWPQAYAVTSAEKQAELDEALARLDALQTEINQLAVDYDAALLAHADAEARMYDAQAREQAARMRITELQAQLGNRATQMYRNGNSSFLDVLFGAQSFTDFITALDLINRVNENDARLVQETKTVRTEAEAARIEYTNLEQIAREQQEQIGRIKQETEAAQINLQSEIEALEAEVVELLLQEEIAAEAARNAAANRGVSSYGEVSEEQLARVFAMQFQYPFSSPQPISSGFGWRDFDNSFHLGTDFAAPGGTPIMAIGSGTVIAAGVHSLMGNYVIVSHGNGVRSTYMHASALASSAGQTVSAGTVVSYVGTTGNSTGNHLHLQIDVDNIAINPMLFF